MTASQLRKLLEQVADGGASIDDAVARLQRMPFEDVEGARIDTHRALRCGFPEVIFGEGKSPAEVERIFAALVEAGANVLATRVRRNAARRVVERFPAAEYHPRARVLTLRQVGVDADDSEAKPVRSVGVICAGTADLPVAEEARLTLEMLGQRVETFHDVGVAGLHRLLAHLESLQSLGVLIVVAGMEGALPSVVGGLTDKPVIAVPTSVGYGAALGGLAALLGMLNSCASNVTVVNINNGFGAAYQAALTHRMLAQEVQRALR